MGNSESVWKEIKRKTNAKGGNPASPRNPKKSVRQAARLKGINGALGELYHGVYFHVATVSPPKKKR